MIYNIWYQKYIIVKLHVFLLVGLCVGLGLLVVGGWLRNSSVGNIHWESGRGFPVILTTTCELQSSSNLWYKYIYKFNNWNATFTWVPWLLFASDPDDLFILILTWRVLSFICHSESSIHFKDVQQCWFNILLYLDCNTMFGLSSDSKFAENIWLSWLKLL